MINITIPQASLDTHIGVLGRTGSGKTYTARGLVERLLADQRQVVVVDPTGAWWGLRSHYAVPIFGGEHGDVAIEEDSGEAVARTIIENGTSAIVDLSLLARQSGAAMRRFMRAFIARLKDKPNGAIWLVLDEADEFLPQTIPGGMESLFGDLKWIVRRGRVAGWRVMMITQRPQDIAKSVLTQIGTLIAHRLTAPQDRKAIEEWVKGHADSDEAKAVLNSLAALQTGEAWLWWPDGGTLERGTMPEIQSFDSSATPDASTGAIQQPELTAIDMSAIRATLAGSAEKLRPGSVESMVADHTIEMAVGQQQLDDLQARVAELIRANAECASVISDQIDQISRMAGFAQQILAIAKGIPASGAGQGAGSEVEDSPTPHSRSKGSLRPDNSKERRPATLQSDSMVRNGSPHHAPAPAMNAAARKMLEMLDGIAPARVPWGSLAAMVGNKARGGNFNAARKALRESGLIVEEGDTVRSAAPAKGGMSRQEAIELWCSVLANPAPRMIDALHRFGPISKQDLGEALGIVPRGGNFNSGVAQLIRNGVAIDQGGRLMLAKPLPGEKA